MSRIAASLLLLLLVAQVSRSLGDITVDSRTKLALQSRTARSEVIWCDLFYAEDFPDSSECAASLDGDWDYFPACCNGAFNCLNGSIWDMMLCPAHFIYDSQVDRCVPFSGSECPRPGLSPGDPTSTETPPISCGTIRNGRLPYQPECTKYIQCSQGVATLHDCLEGYIFYVPFATCLPGEVAWCDLYHLGA